MSVLMKRWGPWRSGGLSLSAVGTHISVLELEDNVWVTFGPHLA